MSNKHRRRRRDETVELRRVGGVNRRRHEHTADTTKLSRRRCEHTRRQSWPSLQFPVLTTDKWRHNGVIVEKIVKIHEYYTTQQIRMFINMQRHNVTSYPTSIALAADLVTAIGCVFWHRRIRWQSSWASCEFMYTPLTQTRRDKTVSSRRRRRCVLGLSTDHLHSAFGSRMRDVLLTPIALLCMDDVPDMVCRLSLLFDAAKWCNNEVLWWQRTPFQQIRNNSNHHWTGNGCPLSLQFWVTTYENRHKMQLNSDETEIVIGFVWTATV